MAVNAIYNDNIENHRKLINIVADYQKSAVEQTLHGFQAAEISTDEGNVSFLLDLELQEHKLLARQRTKLECDFEYRTKALELVKERLKNTPDLEVEKEFEKLIEELARADTVSFDVEDNDENLKEIDQRIIENKSRLMRQKFQNPEAYYQKLLMVEEQALKTTHKLKETDKQLRHLENDNILKPGIAKKLKELEKHGKVCDEELTRYMETCDSFSLRGHKDIIRKRKMVVNMMDESARQCGDISKRIQNILPRIKNE